MIRLEGDPVLKERCASFDFATGDAPALAKRLAEIMVEARGLGLAAPQIGEAVRAFVIKDGARIVACFNPVIIFHMNGSVRMDEGCLSYPGVFVRVKRAVAVSTRFQDETGAWRERVFDGMAARAFQHELDHLDGRTLPDLVPAQTYILARARAAGGVAP